jgi:hypothetical protein
VLDYERCILCYDINNIKGECYNCELCIETRKYLAETNKLFKLVSYGRLYDQRTEIWQCINCNYYIEYELLNPSITRDYIHESARKIHINKWCEKLKTGEISIG